MTRVRDVLKIVEHELLLLGYSDEIDIVKGHIAVQIQFENRVPTVVIKDREISKAVKIAG